ncbi:hypothetical protein [Blastococcus sp. CT_GayMR16]|uniref:hypothetical protein n=1 Tax=Blastococcus sp. CT_GayMR16 TaxID=2559607 RepID=UPI0010746F63|nr:hypothetical protein [Blastococcus sp. CT_GayMR16]TFV81392.1 hypothetical protein E4P38_22375 [Blastococcus sp. CT_GayMR16]
MRWQQLFADLQAQFEAEEGAIEQAESASRTRAEVGASGLADRLRGAEGFPLVLGCRGAGTVAGVLVEVGADWLLVEDDGGRPTLVALAAVRSAAGLGRRTAAPELIGEVRGRLDLRRALRGLARDRSAVQIVLDDGSVLGGTLDRVGADYVELAEHPADLPRRSEAVQGVRAVVIAGIAVVRTVTSGLD